MTATTTAPFHPYTWAPTEIADRDYEVTAARLTNTQVRIDGEWVAMPDQVVGENNPWGKRVERIVFYTGFAGCPARYYITTEDGRTTVSNA